MTSVNYYLKCPKCSCLNEYELTCHTNERLRLLGCNCNMPYEEMLEPTGEEEERFDNLRAGLAV